MGIDYRFDLGIGYAIDHDQLIQIFGEKIKQKFHFEKRFDPKTGEPAPLKKVIDFEEDFVLKLDGHPYDPDDLDEFLEALCSQIGKQAGCDVSFDHDVNMYAEGTGQIIVIGPAFTKNRGDETDFDRITVSGSLDYEELIATHNEIIIIGDVLRKMKFKIGAPKAMILYSIS